MHRSSLPLNLICPTIFQYMQIAVFCCILAMRLIQNVDFNKSED